MTSNGPQRINRLLSRKDAANFLTELGLTISAQTLARLLCEKKGPMCMRVGSRAMYRECDLLDYFRQQCSAPRQSSDEPLRPASNDHLPFPANDRDSPRVTLNWRSPAFSWDETAATRSRSVYGRQ